MVSRPTSTSETVAISAVAAALEQRAGAILVMSTSGNTTRLIPKFRPLGLVVDGARDAQTSGVAAWAGQPGPGPGPGRAPGVGVRRTHGSDDAGRPRALPAGTKQGRGSRALPGAHGLSS